MTSRNSIFDCQHSRGQYSRLIKLPNYANIIVSKPPIANVSIFPYKIKGIFSFRSQKQMLRANAWWIVTMMQNAYIFRNRTIVNFPRYAMCQPTLWRTNHSIATWNSAASPQPTAMGFVDLRPKTLFKRNAPPTIAAAKFTRFSLCRKRFSFESLAASLAIKNWHRRIIQQTA